MGPPLWTPARTSVRSSEEPPAVLGGRTSQSQTAFQNEDDSSSGFVGAVPGNFFSFSDNLRSTKKCVFEAFPDSFCPNASACYGKMTPMHLRYVTCVREGQGYRPGK